MFLLLFLLFASSIALESPARKRHAEPEWNYDRPETWGRSFPTCNGLRQSPINLVPNRNIINRLLPPIQFHNYNRNYPVSIKNNGHTLELGLVESNSNTNQHPHITGGDLNGRYNFAAVHFHWNRDTTKGGSEHTINSVHYPAEMHIVHFNSKYRNVEEAARQSDGLAVLGVLMNESPSDNPILARYINLFGPNHILREGQVFRLPIGFPLNTILPQNTNSFYRYSGSLTTPGCQESVTWFVFDRPIPISRNQILRFSSLMDGRGQRLSHTFRPVQRLNGRRIFHTGPLPGK